MKIFKRTVSVFLAFLMIFSSVSLLASAELNDGNGNSSAFRIEYYRYDSEAAEWVPTDAIKRGDQLQVRFFAESDYAMGTSQFFWTYAKNFMTLNTDNYTYNGMSFDLSNIANTSATSIPAVNGWVGYWQTALVPGGFGASDAAAMLISDGYLSEEYFEDKAWIAVTVNNGTPSVLTDDEYLFAFTFDVHASVSEDVTVLADEGFMYVPEDSIQNTTDHDYAYVFVGEAKKSTAFNSWEGWEQDYSYTLNDKDTISTKSKLILNTGADGYYSLGEDGVADTGADTDDDVKTTYTAEEIGTAIAVPTAEPIPYSSENVFAGWALADDETLTVLTADDFANLEYGYNNIELVAVYEAAEATATRKLVYQNEDGTWPSDDEIVAMTGTPVGSSIGETVKASDYTAETGYYVYNPDDSVTVTADDTDILIVKLARNTVTVTFDGADEISGLYGATVTAPTKTTDAGYTNSGWYTVAEDGTKTLAVEEGKEFTLPAADTNYVSDVTADKQDVTVNVVYYNTIAKENKTVSVTFEDATVTGGAVEIVEAVPETPVDGVTYILLSDIAAKANLEHYAYAADSSLNNLTGTASATGLTLTVGYEAVEYTATFDTTVDGVADVVETVTYGGTVAADALPTKEAMEAANPGYTFAGWYTTVDGAEVAFVAGETIVEGDVTYTAKFTANKVKITYAYEGDDIPAGDAYKLPDNRTDAIYDETFSLPAITAPNGYILKWTVDGATKVDETTYKVGTTDVTVTGTWSLETYNITYYYWDTMTEADVMDEATLTYKQAIPTDVVAEMPGYQFVEWVYYNAETNTIENHTTMPAYDLYAIATFNQVKYTVQFLRYDLDESDFVEIDTVADYYQGMVLNSQVPATGLPENYTFLGWKDANGNAVTFTYTFDFTDAEGNYVVIPEDSTWTYDAATASATLEVYADYLIPVEFDPNGGTVTVDGAAQEDSVFVDTRYNEAIAKDENNWNIARDGFTFDGWDPLFENGDEITPEESTYFMALWLPNINYVFAGNAPTSVKAPATVEGAEYDTLIDVPEFKVPGYSYTVSYSADALDNGDGTYNIGDMPVTVTYTWTADGDVKYTVQTYLENSDVTATEFDAANYTFKEDVTRTGTTGDDITFAEELYKGFRFEKLEPADATIGGDGLTVVKAYYSRNTVNITVKDEDGNEIKDENGDPIVPPTAETDDEITEPTYKPDTDEPGKEFDKWVEEDGVTPVEWPIIVDGEEDIVIKPTYKYTDYSVTYVTDATGEAAPEGYELPQTGENATYVNTEVAHYGNAVAVPDWNNDTVPGYNVTITVTGDGAVENNGAYTVGEGDVVVTAKWSKDIFTVTYVTVGTAPDGYTLPENVPSATIGTKVEVPEWTAPDGYELKLEVVGAERQNDGTYEVYNSNVTVTATWTALESQYIIHTFEMGLDGNYDEANPAVSYGTGTTGKEATYTAPGKEGFTPDKTSYTVTVTADDTDIIKVYYSRNKNNLIYKVNGVAVNTVPTYYGAAIDLKYQPDGSAIPAGYDFVGWSTTEGATTPDESATMGNAETTLYAVLKLTDYSITYVTVGTAPENYELPNETYKNTYVAHYGSSVAVPDWNNDTVPGYNVTITVTGAAGTAGAYTVGEDNVVVTATWTYDEYALTYSYDTTAPTGAAVPASESIHIGKVVTLATPADVAGYTFAGWVINGTAYKAGDTYTAAADSVAAVGSWTANEGVEYFVRRHFEVIGQDGVYGAEENLIRMTGKAGDPATYSEQVPGFDLDHISPANATIGGDGNTVIDVYYTRKSVQVTFLNEDGTTNTELSGTVEFGDKITKPAKDPVSADEGKSFETWTYEDDTEITSWPITVNDVANITIKPKFYNNTYTVRFLISADKVYTENTDAEYSTTIAEPDVDPDPTKYGKTGYTFIEWRRGSVDGAAWTAADTVPVNGVDYYAYFTPNSNITYKINKYFQNVELTDWDYSLTKVETVTDATAGEEVTLDLAALAVEGFTINEDDSIIKQVINGNGNTEFVVYYLRNKTTVNIDGVDEEVIFGDELTEEEVEQIIKENGTYDEGYEYTGWIDEENKPVTFPYTIPASGGKLTPVYTLKSFTLTFVDEDGNELQSGKVEYKTALNTVKPEEYPAKEGYTPTGWFDVADGTAMPATMPAKDVTYTVAYTKATNTAYTITIYVMDLEGNYTIKTSTTAYGTTGDTAMIVPEEQIGLYEDTTHADRNLSGIIAADGSTELRIYYAREKYTVTYDGTPVEAYYGSAVPAPAADPVAPAKGQEFAGWIDANGKQPSDYASMPADDLVFTSTWTPVEYTVTYVVNGTVTTKNYNYGDTIETPETPNVPGMTFTGWVCDGVAGIPATMPDKDIVVVAQFGTAYYTVTFLDDVNGAEFDKITVMYGAAITLPAETPTKEYHTFVEWSNVPETMPAENIVIVPEFERVPVKLVPKTGSTTVIDYEENIIYGLKTSLSDSVLREQFLAVEGDGYIVINTYNGQYGFYGTGATVDLYDNVTGELLETYTIIVFGDINGDSRINSTDSSMISSEINMTNIDNLWSYEALATYDKYKVMAADINMDGKINATDKGTITNATLGSVKIDQVTREVIRADA